MQLSSREASSEELLNSDECGSDSDIEIAEEAFDSDDSQDSDIEVDSQRDEVGLPSSVQKKGV